MGSDQLSAQALTKSEYPGGDKPRPYEHTGIGTFGINFGILSGINAALASFFVGEGLIPSLCPPQASEPRYTNISTVFPTERTNA